MPDTSVHKLPFSQEADADGARFVWFNNCRAGLPYSYVRTADVPHSVYFRELNPTSSNDRAMAGDVAWWPRFMGVVASPIGPIVTGPGHPEFEELVEIYGEPRFFRRVVVEHRSSKVPRAP